MSDGRVPDEPGLPSKLSDARQKSASRTGRREATSEERALDHPIPTQIAGTASALFAMAQSWGQIVALLF